MRGALAVLLLPTGYLLLSGCQDIFNQNSGADAGASTTTDAGNAEAGILGGGCGAEQNSGVELCAATSMCPNVVVDTQAMPGCGFRIRGEAVDLVCACGTSLCPMGTVATCADATQLLANQTQQGVCTQVAEGRCTEISSSSSTTTTKGGNPACDQQCVRDCGGGSACASICNCD